jgi:aromatase
MTNDIENWTNLFSEYKEAKILKKEGNWIFFQLTTHPDENQKTRTWKSERIIDKKNKTIRAKRIDPLFPFVFMNIEWFYNELSTNVTEMVWAQDFEVDSSCKFSEKMMVEYLNKTSNEQMRVIKNNIESRV